MHVRSFYDCSEKENVLAVTKAQSDRNLLYTCKLGSQAPITVFPSTEIIRGNYFLKNSLHLRPDHSCSDVYLLSHHIPNDTFFFFFSYLPCSQAHCSDTILTHSMILKAQQKMLFLYQSSYNPLRYSTNVIRSELFEYSYCSGILPYI